MGDRLGGRRLVKLTFLILAFLMGTVACGVGKDFVNSSDLHEISSPRMTSFGTVTLELYPREPIALESTRFLVTLTNGGKAIEGAKVFIFSSMPDMNHGDLYVEAMPIGEGRYEGSGSFEMGGSWETEIIIDLGEDTSNIKYLLDVQEKPKE